MPQFNHIHKMGLHQIHTINKILRNPMEIKIQGEGGRDYSKGVDMCKNCGTGQCISLWRNWVEWGIEATHKHGFAVVEHWRIRREDFESRLKWNHWSESLSAMDFENF